MKNKNDIIGTWLLLEYLYTDKHRARHYWKVECINCKLQKKIEESNMNPVGGKGKCQDCWGYSKGYSGFKDLLYTYKKNAVLYGREFSLTDENFKTLTSQHCHYCESPPMLIRKTKAQSRWGDYYYNGIDRINNDFGYIEGNCVACCKICNRAKNNMTYEDFVTYINRIKSLGVKK